MLTVGAIGYLAAGLLYALLALLMLLAWIRRRGGGVLVAASAISAIWAIVLSAQAAGVPLRPELVFSVEVIRTGAWLWFLRYLLLSINGARWLANLGAWIWPSLLFLGLVFGFAVEESAAGLASIGGLALVVVGLLTLEQVYRNSPPESRWALNPLALGIGGLLAYDTFLYSQSILFGQIDPIAWFSRGAVNVVFVPFIALAARRNPSLKLDIFVSRQVVFYTTTLVAVGIYLVAMSLGGYLLLRFGGDWGPILRLTFFAGAVVVLLALLFSSGLRSRARVFLSKHFFRNKYDYRAEWLRLVATMSNFDSTNTAQNAIHALAQIVDSPGGALWIRDENAQYRVAETVGCELQLPDLGPQDSLVSFVSRDGWLIDWAEFRRDPELYRGLEMPGWVQSDIPAWLIVPLLIEKELVGFVLVLAAPHTPRLNYEDRDLLKTVGRHIAVHLAQEKAEADLAEAQQFAAYNKLTAFLMHDLNNLIAQQSLIVENAGRHRRNPEFVDDAIETVSRSVERMKRLMAQLKGSDSGTDTLKPSQVKHLVSTAVDRCASNQPVPSLSINDVEDSIRVDAERFIAVIGHLIRNAQDATREGGAVAVSLSRRDQYVQVSVTDDGVGMAPEFVRARLFKPFESTKGARGMGIGAYQAREFARSMGGNLEIESEPGAGTTVRVLLPVTAC